MDINVQVELSVLKTMDARDDPTVQLRISDRNSTEVLVHLDITAGQWLAMQSGSVLTLEGTTGNHLDRIGKKMNVREASIPRDAITSYKRDEAHDQAFAWAAQRAVPAIGDITGETVEVRQTNSGWVAIYRSWS